MSEDPESRILRSLIEYDMPLHLVAERLKQISWDSSAEICMEENHILSVLNKFIEGKISSRDVEKWANLIEGRENIVFRNEGWMNKTIYELANPYLTEVLTVERARAIISSQASP